MGIPNDKITATRPITSPPMFFSFSFRLRRRVCGSTRPGPRCPLQKGSAIRYGEIKRKVPRKVLLDFADLHGLVSAEIGIADRGAFGSGGVAGGDGEFAAVTFALNFVSVAVALGTRHRQGTVRNEFFDADAITAECHIAALGLSNLEEVASNAGEIDGLRGCRAAVG